MHPFVLGTALGAAVTLLLADAISTSPAMPC
ncbi:YtxH domain-containing protein [Streptomyces sp. NPDC001586]